MHTHAFQSSMLNVGKGPYENKLLAKKLCPYGNADDRIIGSSSKDSYFFNSLKLC